MEPRGDIPPQLASRPESIVGGGSRCPFSGRRPWPREARPLPSIGWLAHRQRPTGLPSQAPGLQLWFMWSHDALATPAVSVQDVGATVPHRRPAQRASLPAHVRKGFWGVRDRAFSPPLRRTFFFSFFIIFLIFPTQELASRAPVHTGHSGGVGEGKEESLQRVLVTFN